MKERLGNRKGDAKRESKMKKELKNHSTKKVGGSRDRWEGITRMKARSRRENKLLLLSETYVQVS